MTDALNCPLCDYAAQPRASRTGAPHAPTEALCPWHAQARRIVDNPPVVEPAPGVEPAPRGAGCHYCGRRGPMTWDHIVPKALGGPDAGWNLVTACGPCNQAKGATITTCRCDRCVAATRRVLGAAALTPQLIEEMGIR